MNRLSAIGLTSDVERAFAGSSRDAEVTLGRVARVDRGEVLVLAEHDEIRAASDSLRAQDMLAPVTGDWVAVADDADVGPAVDRIFERRNALVRRDPAEQVTDQVLVANIDRVAVVHGLDRPANDARLERFLVLAIDSGAEPLIVLTKADLGRSTPDDYAALESVAPIVVTRSDQPESIEALYDHVAPGETLVLIGASGVGKSTLVNALVGSDVTATSEVREGDRRGRHTTTVRELIELPRGGVIIDTPGIRAIAPWEADIALDEVFADVVAVAADCRFRDCTHRNEPDCAVRQAVRDGEIDRTRVARYQLLWQELAVQAEELERQNRQPQPGRRSRRRRRRR